VFLSDILIINLILWLFPITAVVIKPQYIKKVPKYIKISRANLTDNLPDCRNKTKVIGSSCGLLLCLHNLQGRPFALDRVTGDLMRALCTSS